MTKKIQHAFSFVFAYIMTTCVVFAQDILPDLPAGQSEAESGDVFGFLFVFGKYLVIFMMSGLLVWITIAFGAGTLGDFYEWYKGRKEGSEISGRTLIGLTFMVLMYVIFLWAMGWVRGYEIDAG